MASSSNQTQPITLHFPNIIRVAGETVEGRVDLNLPLVRKDGIEHLQIEMRGVIKTQIYRQYGQTGVLHKQTVPLFSLNEDLWTSATPETGSDVLSCPFRFTLPENLPPSFHYGKFSTSVATIRYSLEVVGERPGVFHRNRRVRKIFPVMPVASERELLAKEALRQGWAGPWKIIAKDEKMRQGIWGDYSHVHATLSIPDLPSLPVATPIPYSFDIVTETKPVDRTDGPEDKHGKLLFPVPPIQSSELTQALRRQTEYHVRGKWNGNHHEKRKTTYDLQSGRTLADDTEHRKKTDDHVEPIANTEAVHAVVDPPEWIPKDEKGRGIWRRSVRFNSTLTFPFAPTSSTETIDWTYTLQFVVPFPGLRNDLKLEVPIHLGPAMTCPPPPTGAPGSSGLTYADVLPAGPPPMFDLPPTYWTSEDHDWDDEKDEKK
ncbi:hypothetical protein B0H19DRAFT_1100705 [Mycena capillaripes]|nr:hypothetical protein B0H19DRAFT_1100705 [Mycena capillaripes]